MSAVEEIVAGATVRSALRPIVDIESGAVVAHEALARGPEGDLDRPDRLFRRRPRRRAARGPRRAVPPRGASCDGAPSEVRVVLEITERGAGRPAR